MILDYENGVFLLSCRFNDNYLIENLDKRWSKAKRVWRVYDAEVNRQELSRLPFKEVSDKAKEALEGTTIELLDDIPHLYKTEPLPFQAEAVPYLLQKPIGALFAPVGSGKSKIIIDVAQSLYKAGKIDEVVIICLASIIRNWGDELDKHWLGPLPPHRVLSTEGFSAGGQYDRVKGTMTDRTMIVVDESQKIKNMNAKRTQKIIKIGEDAGYRYIMTGTEVLNGKSDLFAQYRFLHKDVIGISTFIGFRNRHCVMGGYENRQIIGYKREDELMDKLKPYTFVINKKEALPFLPSQTFIKREVKKSKEQTRIIKKLQEQLLSEVKDGDDDTIQNALTLMLRISQVTGGFTQDKEPVSGPNPKLAELKNIVDGVGEDEQIVIFCRFLPEIDLLLKELPNSAAIRGGINKKERHQINLDFQNGKYKFLIAQFQSGAVGLNMHAARICIYYSFDFSLEMYLQSIGRIARMQQTRPMLYYVLLMAGTVDKTVYNALSNKENVATYVKAMLSGGKGGDLIC